MRKIHINWPTPMEVLGRLGKLTELGATWSAASKDGELTEDEFLDLLDGVAQVLSGKPLSEMNLKLTFLQRDTATLPPTLP